MKLIKLVVFIGFVVFFTNCEEADSVEEIKKEQEDQKPDSEEPIEPKEITYFTYKAPDYFDTSESDDWVIIHDQNGQLLDYRALEVEDVLVFKKMDTALTNTDNLTVTTFTSHIAATSDVHVLNTYPQVPVGYTWNNEIETNGFHDVDLEEFHSLRAATQGKEAIHANKGNHNITVSDIPGIEKYNITSAVTGYVTANFNPTAGNDLSLENLQLSAGVNYIFFIADAQGGLKYLFFEIDENTQDLNFDYNEFEDFDHVLETQLPENSNLFSVSRGFETSDLDNRGHEMTVEINFNNPGISKIGYINGFESYTTNFHLAMTSGYGYRYFELSTAPLTEIMILPKPTFSIIDKTPYSYEFETDISFVKASTSWRYEENLNNGNYIATQWNIHIPNSNALSIGQIPEELIMTHPKISLELLKHGDTDLVIRGDDYSQFLKSKANPSNYQPPKIVETVVLKTIEE